MWILSPAEIALWYKVHGIFMFLPTLMLVFEYLWFTQDSTTIN